MIKLAIIVSVLLRVTLAADPLRVYKGKPDSENEFPFIVLFYLKIIPQFTFRTCTGSLIAENWVLTAAHCLIKDFKLAVRYGDFTLPPTETSLISDIIETFAPPTSNLPASVGEEWEMVPRDDIGLVLVEKIPKKHANILALDYKTLFGLPVKFAGFGRTSGTISEKFSLNKTVQLAGKPLQIGEGIVVPCYNFENIGPVVCVAAKCSNKKQMTLPGDSGGPLVLNGSIIGVTKGGATQHVSLSGAFTPVNIYLQWIKEVMNNNDHNEARRSRVRMPTRTTRFLGTYVPNVLG
ncbi:renal glandular kallikrein-like [Cydia strobilella]|uniref:renal glandular kallikrein-like n=1 Tax=Cydia strobilella TaxID=1100964 RepID=UPI00300636C7